MDTQRVNYTKTYSLLSRIWNSHLIGKGTLSRILSKQLIPAPKGELICRTLYGFDLLINPSIDNGVEKNLYYFGTYEVGTLDFIKKNLREGSVFLDVGANIGLMSIFASFCVGKTGKVYCFEANPDTVKLLKFNIDLNTITNAKIIAKAVGNAEGKVRIYNNWKVNRGGATLIKPEHETESFEVDLIRIDNMEEFNNLDIDMIKIDVEGFEMDVLKGLEKILKRPKAPKLIIECSTDRNNNYDSVHELYNFIKASNAYRIFKLSRSKERTGKLIEIFTKEDLPKHDNIFCML